MKVIFFFLLNVLTSQSNIYHYTMKLSDYISSYEHPTQCQLLDLNKRGCQTNGSGRFCFTTCPYVESLIRFKISIYIMASSLTSPDKNKNVNKLSCMSRDVQIIYIVCHEAILMNRHLRLDFLQQRIKAQRAERHCKSPDPIVIRLPILLLLSAIFFLDIGDHRSPEYPVYCSTWQSLYFRYLS